MGFLGIHVDHVKRANKNGTTRFSKWQYKSNSLLKLQNTLAHQEINFPIITWLKNAIIS